jgi:hypothetical protein
LKISEVLSAELRLSPIVFGDLTETIRRHATEFPKLVIFMKVRFESSEDLRSRQDEVASGIVDDGPQPQHWPIYARRIRRYGNNPGVEATKEGADIIESGRKQEQSTFTGGF